MEFFSAPNLVSPTLSPGRPWDFTSPKLEEVRLFKKLARRAWMNQPTTEWNAYSAVRGVVSTARISGENPANGLRGIVVDYDAVQSIDSITENLDNLKVEAYRPNYVEITLGKKVRLVWIFERELLVNGNQHCQAVLETFFKKLSIPTLLPGYDAASVKPTQIWTNGGDWYKLREELMPWSVIFGTAVEASKTASTAPVEVPLDKIFDELNKRWPNRWRGPFELDTVGIRFWDDKADNETGCQVKPDGMLCFTGPVPFMRWEQIFGAKWVSEQRTLNLGQAAADIYFDGKSYWTHLNSVWYDRTREDVSLELRTKGISGRVGKGQAASDVDRVLHFIQTANRIDGAAPLVNYRPGVLEFEGQRILNVSRIKALEPAAKDGVDPETDFPWLNDLIKGLFRDECAIDTIHAWTKRFYTSQLYYKKAMGQAIFICGPRNNGKTLFCMRVLKPLFGNKSANPFDYFTGVTSFNSELFETSFLAINDEEAPEREAVKNKFLARLKSFVVNPQHAYHPKFCDRLSIDWTGRICSTLNDDAWSVGLLPEVNRNTEDKLCFFASHARPNNEWPEGEVIEETLARELPFYAKWLLEWKVPDTIWVGGRMGVRSYFDPRILSLSRQQFTSFQAFELLRLWSKISATMTDENAVWEGTATHLHAEFSACPELSSVVKEWTVYRLAKALVDLSRVQKSGVEMLEGGRDRKFKLSKAALVSEDKPVEEKQIA